MPTNTESKKVAATGVKKPTPLPTGFIVDINNNNVLYASPLSPQFGLPVLTELRKCTFNSVLRIVSSASPLASLEAYSSVKNKNLRWREDRWNASATLEEVTTDLESFSDKKTLVNEKAIVIRSLLFYSFLILSDYAQGYGDIDYDSAISYALANETLLDEYGIANGLTREQAQRELSFDYHERQTKKFRIYAYQRKFLQELSLANSVDAVNDIKKAIQDHFWRNGFV